MKQSLLEMTQDILSDMSDDEVNSIDDTFDSAQVANILRSTYQSMMSNRNWPHLRKLIQIIPSGQTGRPTHMYLQEGIKEIVFINYNCSQDKNKLDYRPMKWREPDDFLRFLNTRDNTKPEVDVIQDDTGVQLLILNNKAPQYYTSFDDEYLVFDSYDMLVDDTLQESKVQAMAYIMPQWNHTDSFIPDLPSEAFSALLAEAKSATMLRLNQTQDIKAEQDARRQQSWLSRKAWRAHGGIQYPNYGRRGKR